MYGLFLGFSSLLKSIPLLPVNPPYKSPKYFNLEIDQCSGTVSNHSNPDVL